MSNYNWCHGPNCHKSHTQDRIRGVKGSKVLRTRKVTLPRPEYINMYSYFCSNGCYNDYANTHINEIVALHPRTEALETPIDVVKEQATDYFGRPYVNTKIVSVDNNGG